MVVSTLCSYCIPNSHSAFLKPKRSHCHGIGTQWACWTAKKNTKVHIGHPIPSAYVLRQSEQTDTLENPCQMQSNFTKLDALAEAQKSILPPTYRAVSQLEQTFLFDHKEAYFRTISALPLSQNPSFSM